MNKTTEVYPKVEKYFEVHFFYTLGVNSQCECGITCVTALTVAFARYFLSEILRSFLTELSVAKQPKGKKNENELQMSGACPRKGEVIGEGNLRTSQL